MSKRYDIETKFGSKWVIIDSKTIFADALHHVKEHGGEKYPLRIVRVVKTIVFEDKK